MGARKAWGEGLGPGRVLGTRSVGMTPPLTPGRTRIHFEMSSINTNSTGDSVEIRANLQTFQFFSGEAAIYMSVAY